MRAAQTDFVARSSSFSRVKIVVGVASSSQRTAVWVRRTRRTACAPASPGDSEVVFSSNQGAGVSTLSRNWPVSWIRRAQFLTSSPVRSSTCTPRRPRYASGSAA